MNSDQTAEMQHWQARTDDLQVALERIREERDELSARVRDLYVANETLYAELKAAKGQVARLLLRLEQGVEL